MSDDRIHVGINDLTYCDPKTPSPPSFFLYIIHTYEMISNIRGWMCKTITIIRANEKKMYIYIAKYIYIFAVDTKQSTMIHVVYDLEQ